MTAEKDKADEAANQLAADKAAEEATAGYDYNGSSFSINLDDQPWYPSPSRSYKTAKRLIAEAKASRAKKLSLSRGDTPHLEVLPPEISELHHLTFLSLNGTQVSGLAPLAGLTALTNLQLNETSVSDLAPLMDLTALVNLSLNGTRVGDLAPLAGLTALTNLRLARTYIIDLVPLAGLRALTTLHLDKAPVYDLAPLTDLRELTNLSLNGTQVSDLAPLARLTVLTRLQFSNTPVSDLAPLAGLTRLLILEADNTLVNDLAPLAGLTALTNLQLDRTLVSDLVPLSNLRALRGLHLEKTPVSDLEPLAGLAALTNLSLNGTKVSDLEPLAGLTALTNLRLNGTPASDLRPLRSLGGLAHSPSNDGLSILGSGATQIDPRIFQIGQLRDPADRARTLIEYLGSWQPPAEPPGQRSAPIMVKFDQDDYLVESLTTNLAPQVERRARDGWKALKEVHADAVDTLARSNLPNLERAMAAFGRALGHSFEQVQPILLGTHGQRIVEISKDARNILMDDAASDLVAFAAAIQTYLQRFPDWIEYLRDTAAEADVGPPLQLAAPQLEAVSQALKDADFISPTIPAKLDGLIEASNEVDLLVPLARRGVLRSLSNILSPIAERVLKGGRQIARDLANESYKTGIKATVATTGMTTLSAATDLLANNGRALLWLAQNYPQHLGWIEGVLRALGVL